ncbi:MAG: ABC transporter ATP-binding protein [Armatimonadetes bacterium]|nr:ABC transporter ATP-binding protein [Armatimonadota bacterium]MDE2206393.1 ABC transporter ATP-binding protein [Armatimonadota bacterium]
MRIEANHLTLSYFDGDRTTTAVRDVTLALSERGFVGIMGPSGSGKSSLLYLLCGLKRPTSGEVLAGGQTLNAMGERQRVALRREHFGFVFQQAYLLNYLTAAENVLVSTNGSAGGRDRIEALLRRLGLERLKDRYPPQLSGGEKQRVAVARAMAGLPDVIFADEPTAALDSENGRAVIDLLYGYRDRGCVVVVTHDAAMLEKADRIYHLADGSLTHSEGRAQAVGEGAKQE